MRLAPSLALCAAGALCIGGQAVANAQLVGLLYALGALASWAWFGIVNSQSLKRLGTVSPHDWSLLVGLMTGVQALALVPLSMLTEPMHHAGAEWLKLAAVTPGVAVLASITGNALWNRMSRLLPLTMVGQMILFETLFALLYGFFWERRPSLLAPPVVST